MITRRQILRFAAALGVATKGIAARWPRLGIAAQIQKPADALKDKIIYKDNPQYETYRRGAVWNARKPNRFPNAIVLAESDKDVIAAVKLAKERGWQVATRSGGHSFTGSHTRDNSVLINIYRMKELSVDPKTRIATVSPAWMGDAFNKVLADQHQLMFPSAHCPAVGLGGFVLCGGHGLNSRLWGPGCANLQALDLVTADGELIHADENKNSDYLWAARGSGPGFFGVAVRFYLNLHPLPTVRKISSYIFEPDVIDELLTWVGKNQNGFPRFLEVAVTGTTANGKPIMRMNGSALGYSEKEVDAALDLLENCPVVKKATTRLVKVVPGAPAPSGQEGRGSGVGLVAGSRCVVDGVWSSATPDKILAAGRDAFLALPTPQSYMLWMHWGPVRKLKDMAYSVQGDVYLSPNAISFNAADDARCAAWASEMVKKLQPVSLGSQMNDENMPANKGPYLSPAAASRLEALRAKYDPDRRFASYLT